ncbi:MAG: hypothetical protein V1647_01660 [Pseudomonadota bacterium]
MFDEQNTGTLTDDGKLIISEAYCHNGHRLIDEEVKISKYPSIKLLVSDGKNEEIINISAIEGDQQKKFKKGFANGTLLIISCPVCKEELDNIAPCDCIKGSKFVAIYLNKKRSFSTCLGVCNSWSCYRSFMGSAWRIISRLADKSS